MNIKKKDFNGVVCDVYIKRPENSLNTREYKIISRAIDGARIIDTEYKKELARCQAKLDFDNEHTMTALERALGHELK